jgi:multidrug efflux pump subunit AcrA (membrane-fusion protein)
VQATSDTLEVQLALDPSQQREVKKGDPAQVTLPDKNSVTGKVDRLGRVAQIATGQNNANAGDATISAYISLDHPEQARGLDRAPVQVNITSMGVESALNVPVTALVGRSGGGLAVEVVRPDGQRALVAVRLGLFDTSGGRVQVEGDLRPGERVAVPSS